jgi:hypothetical protein
VLLAPKDAALLIRQTRTPGSILVGGQAVTFWKDFFGVAARVPASLTRDIDYLATPAEARAARAGLSLPGKLALAPPEDMPNTAVLTVRMDGYAYPIYIDFLSGLIGLDSKEVRSSAVTVEYEGEPLKVIHPIPLMKSKLWNLKQLQAKRTLEGIEQARLSIEIVAAYLRSRSDLGRSALLKTIEHVGKFAATEPARFAREHYSLECLDAVPPEILRSPILPDRFRETRWPQLVAATR